MIVPSVLLLLKATLCAVPLRAQEAPAVASATPVPVLAYQGRLLEATLPVTGTRSFVFSILDATGVELWNSGTQSISVNTGLYGIELGASPMPAMPTSLLAQANLKLRVSVSGVTLTPDTDLVPALQARSAFEVSGSFAGDVGGTQTAMTLLRLQGIPLDLSTSAPTTGQALVYSGTKWIPATVTGTQGPAGPQGPAGATGATGLQGIQGLQGLQGIQGNAGAAGASPLSLNGSDAVFTTGSMGLGISPPNASALLDLTSTTKGFLLPRMTAVQRAAIATPTTGLLVYQTDSTVGLYQYDGSAWGKVGGSGVTSIATTGPLTGGPITGSGTLGISKATGSTDGYLAAADFTTFNTKGSGTVTSVNVSGGTTGLTTSGGAVTSSGTITLGGTLAIFNGGTGSITESGARFNLGLGSVENTALSTWAGSTNITSLGTITTGTFPYANLSGKPALATVATTGAYTDLSGKPVAGTDFLAPNGNGSLLTSLTKTQVGLGNVENLKVNLVAILAPTVSADSSASYAVGSRWVDTVTGKEYVCTDASLGAAVWKETTSGPGGVIATNNLSDLTNAGTARTNLGLGNVEDTALSTWAGSTNITSLGTITTGTFPYANLSGTPTLGTAAALSVGTSAGNLVQLDVTTAKLPAVDGSLLTNVQLLSDANANTKAGTSALVNPSGQRNDAFGSEALFSNTTGSSNEALGYQALRFNTLGSSNIAIGNSALTWNTAASYNIAIGATALNLMDFANGGVAYSSYNVAIGHGSLTANKPTSTSTGIHNVGLGYHALTANSTGAYNVALGSSAGSLLTTGNYNIALGYQAGTLLTTGDYNIDIGHVGVAGEGNTIRIGTAVDQTKAYLAGVYGVAGGGFTGVKSVVMGSDGQLGTVTSASGTVTGVTGTAPVVSSGGTTPAISITQANTTTDGYLSSTDWNTFNGKADLASPTFTGTVTSPAFAGALTGNVTGNVSGTAANVTGTVGVANGGTGATTLTGYVKGSGTSAMTASATIPSTDISGLGTAAALNVGTGVGNIVQLDVTTGKLPAVNGSLLTKVQLLSDGTFSVKGGTGALASNTVDGSSNTAFGDSALNANTTGSYNIGMGGQALLKNTVAGDNIAIGSAAMYNQDFSNGGTAFSSANVAIGGNSLQSNNPTSTSTGFGNTTVGHMSMRFNTIGSYNIGLGFTAGNNLTTGNYNIDIGNTGVAAEANTIRIGTAGQQAATYIAGIYGVGGSGLTTPKTVVMGSDGQLGTVTSASGTVTAVTGTAPVVSSGGTAPDISMAAATGSVDGYLSAANYNTFAAKESALTFNSPLSRSTNAISLGTVGVANGGTGWTTLTLNNVLLGNGTSALQVVAPGTAGNVLLSDGATWTSGAVSIVSSNGNTKGGSSALVNPSGVDNTAFGDNALTSDTVGMLNSAFGSAALKSNTKGVGNTAMGYGSLTNNTIGYYNTALGASALSTQNWNNSGNAYASNNVAIGYGSLTSNNPVSIITGVANTAVGKDSLLNNTTGANNTVLGYQAGLTVLDGNQNVLLGAGADVDLLNATNRIAIGYGAVVNANNKVRIGNGAMTVIEGQVAWTNSSDFRLKENIQSSALGLDFIQKLRPVTYNFITQPGVVQEGLIAQEVEAAAKSLGTTFHAVKVPTTPEGFYSLTYSDFVMPLINATKELKAENDALKAENEDLKARLARIEKVLGL